MTGLEHDGPRLEIFEQAGFFDDRAYVLIFDKSNDLKIQQRRRSKRPVVKRPSLAYLGFYIECCWHSGTSGTARGKTRPAPPLGPAGGLRCGRGPFLPSLPASEKKTLLRRTVDIGKVSFRSPNQTPAGCHFPVYAGGNHWSNTTCLT